MRARVLRLRRAVMRLTLSPHDILPSASWDSVGTPNLVISELNSPPASTPVNATPAALRPPAHDPGPGWFVRPFLYGSFIRDSMPVYPGAYPTPPHSHTPTLRHTPSLSHLLCEQVKSGQEDR